MGSRSQPAVAKPPGASLAESQGEGSGHTMLSPASALRMLCRRTGAVISRATFYRWLSSGKIYSIRLGFRIFIPAAELEYVIRQCLAGERF